MTTAPDSTAVRLASTDPALQLLVPTDDVQDPEITILIPAVNEQLTIVDFVAWCKQGLADAGVVGEILIVDSSTDDTAELALAGGARVLRAPKRGLGRAYIDAIPFVRGRYVIMGDADCTYDFRLLKPFVEAFRAGNEFVMGSRWKGSIEKGAMPPHHQYFGTPFTTWILNRVYSSKFSDIHCGMRGMTLDALQRMGITSQSWEYASEMVLKSVRMHLRTAEVPVTFYKDVDGRLSHHKRSGWFSPFSAAWINLRAMFVHGAEFFVLKPGLVMLTLGLILLLPLSGGDITIGSTTFSLYAMLLGLTVATLGLESFFFGCLAQVLLDYTGRGRRRWQGFFAYTRTTVASMVAFTMGVAFEVALTISYFRHHHTLPDPASTLDHLAVLGLFLMIAGFSTFCFTLVLHATSVRYGHDHSLDEDTTGA